MSITFVQSIIALRQWLQQNRALPVANEDIKITIEVPNRDIAAKVVAALQKELGSLSMVGDGPMIDIGCPMRIMGLWIEFKMSQLYGIGPAMHTLPDLKAWNALPAEERATIIREIMKDGAA